MLARGCYVPKTFGVGEFMGKQKKWCTWVFSTGTAVQVKGRESRIKSMFPRILCSLSVFMRIARTRYW